MYIYINILIYIYIQYIYIQHTLYIYRCHQSMKTCIVNMKLVDKLSL